MKVIVVGCGRMGAELAYRLYQKGHEVTVIDAVESTFGNLPPDFHGRMVEGEALHRDVLHRAGIEHADALAAVSNSDSLNAVIAHVARVEYHIPHVVVRNYDPHWRPIMEAFGLQVICASSWGAQRLEELLSPGALHTVFSAGNGEVEIYEFIVPQAWHGRKLADLIPTQGCIPVAFTHAGRAMLPSPELRLETGDVIHVSATREGMEALCQRAGAPQEG